MLGFTDGARADEPSHDGVFTRITVGADYSTTVAQDPAGSRLRGSAGLASLDLGFSIVERFALQGRLSVRRLIDPKVKLNGRNLGQLENTSGSSGLLAGGFTYYARPNWYLTSVIGIARATMNVGGLSKRSLIGYGFEGDLGHEWGLGGDVGLGLAARVSYYSVPQADGRVEWVGLGALLTATYH